MKLIDEPPSSRCSVDELDAALRALDGRWKILIVYHLFAATMLRFSELRRRLPGVSQKMLSQHLKALEADGIVSRAVYAEVPPRVEYALTDVGRELKPALQALQDWAILRGQRMEARPRQRIG